MNAWLAPVITLVIVVAVDVWVYVDARRCAAAGSRIFFRIGGLTIATPMAWLVGCIVLWIVVVPIYLVSRSRP